MNINYDGTSVDTMGCGCCSDSYPIQSDDALHEAVDQVKILLKFCEMRSISIDDLIEATREIQEKEASDGIR
jgi:hypothetical protein